MDLTGTHAKHIAGIERILLKVKPYPAMTRFDKSEKIVVIAMGITDRSNRAFRPDSFEEDSGGCHLHGPVQRERDAEWIHTVLCFEPARH